MSLRPDFKKELIEILKKSALIIDKSNKYKQTCNEYKALKEDLNTKLLTLNGAVCKDSECYINKQTGEFIPLSNIDINSNDKLIKMFKKLGSLYLQKQNFGWKDELSWSISVILDLAPLKDLEKEIFEHFGKTEGRKIINNAKIEICEFEKENGINIFTKEVENIKKLENLKYLYCENNELEITEENNLIEEIITLKTLNGKEIKFKKFGQLTFNNKIYLDFEIIEKFDYHEFFLYIVEKTSNGLKFIMEEDDDIFDIVSEKFEKYTTETSIKNGKKRARIFKQ